MAHDRRDLQTGAWRREGLCWPPPDLDGVELAAHVARWFPASLERRGKRPLPEVEAAKTICRQCPVQTACLAYALAADEREGIWAATTPDERRRIRSGAA
jgi:Transcription factor WhiB